MAKTFASIEASFNDREMPVIRDFTAGDGPEEPNQTRLDEMPSVMNLSLKKMSSDNPFHPKEPAQGSDSGQHGNGRSHQ